MKEKYLDLMEAALSAYPYEHIVRYFNDVKEKGLTEHGFPRLTANMGILIAHGRRRDLLPLFLEMMEFCCKTIPCVKAANDFSVREMITCIWEVERGGVADAESLARWRSYLGNIDPLTCYTRVATSMDYNYRNWVLFTALSEFFRGKDGLCQPAEFIEFQLQHQMQFFDENGMYLDHKKSWVHHQPMVYDLVPRGLLTLLLEYGYRGKYYEKIDDYLKRAALLTLDMQSPNGEYAFGGRSNQFIHNEGWLVGIFEYEARRYTKEGDLALAARFVAARNRAIAVMERWLTKDPIRHIKNRYPTETSYGCEGYAYFDKYMITVASLVYIAYLLCDESLPDANLPDTEPTARMTSSQFHKLFLKSGGYGLEFDTDADPHYDANGLGRIHRVDAPSPICLSCPCPAQPKYTVDLEPVALSACAAIQREGEWLLGADPTAKYEVLEHRAETDLASAVLSCRFATGDTVKESYVVDACGVKIVVEGEKGISYALPAFCFDGEASPEVTPAPDGKSLSIAYEGWICRYTTDGVILDTGKIAANRNGHYRAFVATGEKKLAVAVEIFRA